MTTELPPRRRPIWIFAIVALLALLWLGVWQRERIVGWFGGEEAPAPLAEAPVEPTPEAKSTPAEESPAALLWRDVTGGEPAYAPFECAEAVAERERLCERLDARAEAEGLEVGEGACARIDAAVAALEAARPILAGEARDPQAMMANATHLFRTAGRAEVRYAAMLLRLEADAIEPVAHTLFRWAACERDERLLYDYAVFGFRTLGGQAYLRRRAPRTEALAAYYGLLVIDRAEREGRNAAGADPRQELLRVRELIQGQPFVFRDDYLDELDAMADRWSSR